MEERLFQGALAVSLAVFAAVGLLTASRIRRIQQKKLGLGSKLKATPLPPKHGNRLKISHTSARSRSESRETEHSYLRSKKPRGLSIEDLPPPKIFDRESSPISYIHLPSIAGSLDSLADPDSLISSPNNELSASPLAYDPRERGRGMERTSVGRVSAMSPHAKSRRKSAQISKSRSNERPTSELGSLIYRGKRIHELGTAQAGCFVMERKLILVMVGLPARGKSYIVKMLTRYLRWIGFPCETFNIGSVRRQLGYAGVDSNFFDKNNREMQALREKMADMVQDEMYAWLREDDNARVAMFDATNTTKSRRKLLMERNSKEKNVGLLFIESICDDPVILERNYNLKLQNEDYKHMDRSVALKDFMARVKAYQSVYETIDDDEFDGHIKYVKLFNVGKKVIAKNVVGFLPSQCSFYLQNIHISPRKIYLTLHAESSGRDSDDLTEEGRQYALLLAKFLRTEQDSLEPPGDQIMVLTGTQAIHTETIAHLTMLYPCASTALLNSVNSTENVQEKGDTSEEGSYLNRRQVLQEEWHVDVIQRVRPLIVELERQTRSLLVVSHLSVIRCLYAYFCGVPMEKIPGIKLDMHTLVELVPGPFGTEVYLRSLEDMQLICS